jgi:glycosyltransferase involved in cell wall biosynthesis
MIKIINICTSNSGGAGNAVLRINEVLNTFSDSHIISLAGESKNKSLVLNNFYFFRLKVYRYLKHLFYQKLSKKFNRKYNFYNYNEENNYLKTSKLLSCFPFQPDILIIHYSSHFINFKTIYEIQKETNCKVIFNIVDTSFMTGGCHWSWDCDGYTNNCSNCPAIKLDKFKNLAQKNFFQKEIFLKLINFDVNVSSSFALKQILKSKLFNHKNPSFIFYPIDQNVFKPQSKSFKKNTKSILFGTQDLRNPSKGVIYFSNAINFFWNNIDDDQRKLIRINIAGRKANLPIKKDINLNFLGQLSIHDLIVEYSKSDVFVCSSVEDNGPMMVNESLMCGTPVVCFNTGIGSDLINKNTGYLAKNMSSEDLAYGIKKVLFDSNNKNLKQKARKYALDNYSNKIIKNKWKELIKNLIID